MTAPLDAAKDARISQLELQIGDLYGAIARKNAALLAAADAIDKEIRLLQRLLPRQWPDNLREMVAIRERLTATTETWEGK